jgi:hypothetical protein
MVRVTRLAGAQPGRPSRFVSLGAAVATTYDDDPASGAPRSELGTDFAM